MSNRRLTQWMAVVAAVGMCATLGADDRDFLREVAAPPNIIFILDSSSSMVSSPEVPGVVDGARINAAMVPGAGDDPYSRLGIAKRVLRDFLETVGEANFALAGYAQAQPPGGSNPLPQKHWVYEARAQDRFHMIESTYAYRMGYAETHAGQLLDVPADILTNQMIGYKLYFDPDTTPTADRFGPTNAFESGFTETLPDGTVVPVPYDLMPIYFGNCYVDNMGTPGDDSDDVTLCGDGVFPFYDAGVPGTAETWYYGTADGEDYPGCDPNDPIWDDGTGNPVPGACENEWEETVGADLHQYRRRVRLEIPDTWGGQPNHFLAVDASGNLVGNEVVVETGAKEDYNLDGVKEGDYDGDDANDWMLYVNSVEERDLRVCVPAANLPTWTPTPTVTPTPTETLTPTMTPTPTCWIDVDNARTAAYGYFGVDITNHTSFSATVTRFYFDWGANMRKWAHIDWVRTCTDGASSYCGSSSEEMIDESSGSYSSTPYTGRYARPYDKSGPPYPGEVSSPVNSTINAGQTKYMWTDIDDSTTITFDGVYELCLDFELGDGTVCPNICAISYEGSFGTPTPTLTPTATITPTAFVWPTSSFTSTPTRTPTTGGVTGTPTRTPTIGTLPTSTPTPWPTPTPRPPTATPTPSKTPTPST